MVRQFVASEMLPDAHQCLSPLFIRSFPSNKGLEGPGNIKSSQSYGLTTHTIYFETVSKVQSTIVYHCRRTARRIYRVCCME